MLVLFESPAGYAIFKLVDENKLRETENLFLDFETPDKASKVVKLKHFEKFNDMTDALAAATATVDGKMNKRLKKVLKKFVIKDTQDELAVADAKLGNIIKEKLHINCIANTAVQELMRCIRSQMDNLILGLPGKEMAAMALGLAHSLSRYKLKFSPDKVDTMIIQAVSLLDDLDKELNNYVMRCKEWYGWHFPELSKIVTDNHAYIKTVQKMGLRTNAAECDLSDILPEELEPKVKEMAEISMGTEISDEDMLNINHLCNEITEMQDYRKQLFTYLQNRMLVVAPNLTTLIGDLIAARLISHAGSLMNLAKQAASTVQIYGAEKALFRALKTKHDTPKYGLIYHAQLIGQTAPRLKGKISRMLAAKTSLAARVDSFAEDSGIEMGAENKLKLENRVKLLETEGMRSISKSGKKLAKQERSENRSEVFQYKAAKDSTLPSSTKRKFEADDDDDDDDTSLHSKNKKIKTEVKQEAEQEDENEVPPKSEKKKKKRKHLIEVIGEAEAAGEEEDGPGSSKKKKKKQKMLSDSIKTEPEDESFGADQFPPEAISEKKKKKRKSAALKTELADAAAESTPLVESGKKKKKKKLESSSIAEIGDQSYDVGGDGSISVDSGKKKKKKHGVTDGSKFEGEIASQSFDQTETSFGGSEKKKKKHKHIED